LVCGGGDGGGGTSTGKISNIYISESDLFTWWAKTLIISYGESV
jgi:hypothetical protein